MREEVDGKKLQAGKEGEYAGNLSVDTSEKVDREGSATAAISCVFLFIGILFE